MTRDNQSLSSRVAASIAAIVLACLSHVQRHPDTVIVIDHLGLLQPARPSVPADVWADLPKLLALAHTRT